MVESVNCNQVNKRSSYNARSNERIVVIAIIAQKQLNILWLSAKLLHPCKWKREWNCNHKMNADFDKETNLVVCQVLEDQTFLG